MPTPSMQMHQHLRLAAIACGQQQSAAAGSGLPVDQAPGLSSHNATREQLGIGLRAGPEGAASQAADGKGSRQA